MKFQEQSRYPFPADSVLKVFRDKNYFLTKYRQAGATNIQLLEDSGQGGSSRIAISRDVEVDVDVPAFAKKFVPQQLTIIQTDSWLSEGRKGYLTIEFKGMPAKVSCAMKLTEQEGQTILDLEFSVSISVPIIGEKLATLLAQDIKKKFQKDAAQAQRIMAEMVNAQSVAPQQTEQDLAAEEAMG